MLPRHFTPHPAGSSEPTAQPGNMLKQAALVLAAVLVLALVAAFATELLSTLTPVTTMAQVP